MLSQDIGPGWGEVRTHLEFILLTRVKAVDGLEVDIFFHGEVLVRLYIYLVVEAMEILH